MSTGNALTYDAETFEAWRQERDLTQPYFSGIHGNVAPLLENANTIIDVAGGDGHTHDVMPPDIRSRLVTADIDEEAIQRLAERYPKAQAVATDTGGLPFDDESFDAAISISGFGGYQDGPARATAREIERVLKPGGTFVYLQDRPYPLRRFATMPIEGWDLLSRLGVYSLPIVSGRSNNVDAFAVVKRANVHSRELARNKMGSKALQATEHLLNNDWLANVYGDEMRIAEYARHFGTLISAVQVSFGSSAVHITEPLAPSLRHLQLGRFKHTTLETEQRDLSVSHRTSEPHTVNETVVDSIYVDELSLPYIIYRAGKSHRSGGTKVQGKTPVYIARKPE